MDSSNYVEILLLEDNNSDAELAMIALEDFNLTNQMVWLKDGKLGLDFLFGRGEYANRNLSHPPKIILLDLKMPKIDGIEFLRALRSDMRTKHIPVTVLTSSKEEDDIIESYKLGVNSYIVKPVNYEQFTKSVQNIGYYWLMMNQPPNKIIYD